MSKQQPASASPVVQAWKGPLPPPEVLRRFKDLQPDAPERILSMAEEEARTRREIMKLTAGSELERKSFELREYHRDVRRGQLIAFVYLMSALIGAVVCACLDCEKVGIAIAGVGAAGIVSNFIWKK